MMKVTLVITLVMDINLRSLKFAPFADKTNEQTKYMSEPSQRFAHFFVLIYAI